ncbi:MAG: ATPase, partial [Rhodospirillales bacterium]|nr:ATPase [Rhodospirillales bacterium]
MEQLPRLQARISSLHELRDLFRALRALAASHVQEAQSALAGIRRYVEVVEDAIAEGAALLPE